MFYIRKYFEKYFRNTLLLIIFSVVSLGIGIAASLVLSHIFNFIHPYLINILNSFNVDQTVKSSMPYLYYAISGLLGFFIFSMAYFWLYGYSSRNKIYEKVLFDIILPILSLGCFFYSFLYLIPPILGVTLIDPMSTNAIRFIVSMIGTLGIFYLIGGVLGDKYSNADTAYDHFLLVGLWLFIISFVLLMVCSFFNI